MVCVPFSCALHQLSCLLGSLHFPALQPTGTRLALAAPAPAEQTELRSRVLRCLLHLATSVGVAILLWGPQMALARHGHLPFPNVCPGLTRAKASTQ